MSDCCNCCGFTSLVGVDFFGITATMVKRENKVFLSHKAGLDLHTVTPEQIDDKFMVMIYTSIVSESCTPSFRQLGRSVLKESCASFWDTLLSPNPATLTNLLFFLGIRGINASMLRNCILFEGS